MLVTTLVVIIAHGQGETYLEEEVPEESYRCASAGVPVSYVVIYYE